MVTKHCIAPIQGSVAVAGTLEGQVPLVGGYDPPMGGYDPPGRNFDRSKLESLRVFTAWCDPKHPLTEVLAVLLDNFFLCYFEDEQYQG